MELTKSLSSELKKTAHSFRVKISHAEDKIDLMNCFSLAAREIAIKGIKKDADIRIDSIPEFRKLLEETDFESQMSHLAETARNRCRHLSKHPEKTNLKIRQR